MIDQKCEQCGEVLEAGFESCWKCGARVVGLREPALAVAGLAEGSDAVTTGARADGVTLTTAPTLDGHRVVRVVDIVSAAGMRAVESFVVTASDASARQRLVRELRAECLDALRREAAAHGANAVVAVSLTHTPLDHAGASMLMLSASGTAIIVSELS